MSVPCYCINTSLGNPPPSLSSFPSLKAELNPVRQKRKNWRTFRINGSSTWWLYICLAFSTSPARLHLLSSVSLLHKFYFITGTVCSKSRLFHREAWIGGINCSPVLVYLQIVARFKTVEFYGLLFRVICGACHILEHPLSPPFRPKELLLFYDICPGIL